MQTSQASNRVFEFKGTIYQFREFFFSHGGMVSAKTASRLLGVSHQAVGARLRAGLLMGLAFDKRIYVSVDEIIGWHDKRLANNEVKCKARSVPTK